jgi:hypothetical protein
MKDAQPIKRSQFFVLTDTRQLTLTCASLPSKRPSMPDPQHAYYYCVLSYHYLFRVSKFS